MSESSRNKTSVSLLQTNIEAALSNPLECDDHTSLIIYRCLKTACHEISHVFGLTHCPYYDCLMNGSNLLAEADLKPFALCPICLRKIEAYLDIAGGIVEREK